MPALAVHQDRCEAVSRLDMSRICEIRVPHMASAGEGAALFGLLGALLPVRFVDDRRVDRAAGEIIVAAPDEPSTRGPAHPLPTLRMPASSTDADDGRSVELSVSFSDDIEVPFPFRGRVIRTRWPASCAGLSPGPGDKVLASTTRGPVWSVSTTGDTRHFESSLPWPRVGAETRFSDVFNADCFLPMLVLLQFLHVAGANDYRNAPLRASFIVDDPNLHWPRYGFIDYGDLARHAAAWNYHVAFATIPIDTWFTHQPTAALFRRNEPSLSLLVHGNNHVKEELARRYSDVARTALLQQALRRIEQLERTADLRVCRVMVPPHGACSADMLGALAQAGFEAACISTGSLLAHNPSEAWARTLGFAPAALINGCPVLPRWAMTGNARTHLILAAYLGQPMILRGHHHDLKNGLDVFGELAQFINGLGEVRWSSISGLCRLNYQWRMEGTVCRIRPFGTSIAFDPPARATAIFVEDLGGTTDSCEERPVVDVTPGKYIELMDRGERAIQIECEKVRRPAFPATREHQTPPGFILRRLLTEARDRLLMG